jgi:hypothetical protein
MPGRPLGHRDRQQPNDDPAVVAKQGFDAFMKGNNTIIAGGMVTKAQGGAAKVLPDSVKADRHPSMAEPGSADAYRRDRLVRRRSGRVGPGGHIPV